MVKSDLIADLGGARVLSRPIDARAFGCAPVQAQPQ